MAKTGKNKMTKDTIPENFTVSMAAVDMIPVVFFGLSAIKVGSLFNSPLFVAGAVLCLASGLLKVLWKYIVAVYGKNVWPLFLQMRILMPAGFLILLIALITDRAKLDAGAILAGLTGFPGCVFFTLGAVGMVLMCVFALRLDSSDPKANWTEQAVNGAAQLCFFIGLMLV